MLVGSSLMLLLVSAGTAVVVMIVSRTGGSRCSCGEHPGLSCSIVCLVGSDIASMSMVDSSVVVPVLVDSDVAQSGCVMSIMQGMLTMLSRLLLTAKEDW